MKRTQRRKGLHQPSPASTLSSPLYERILQFRALRCLRQQGTDVRTFAQRFSDAAEGLGFNHAALKDMFNSVLDEPLSWWRMRGLDHLPFGEFVGFLARSPASEAGAPPVAVTTRPGGCSRACSSPGAHGAHSIGGQWSCSAPSDVGWSCSAPSCGRWSSSTSSGGRRGCGIPVSETEEEEEGFFHPSRPGGRSRALCWPGSRPWATPAPRPAGLFLRPRPGHPPGILLGRSLPGSFLRSRPGYPPGFLFSRILPGSSRHGHPPGFLFSRILPGSSRHDHPPGFLFGRILHGPSLRLRPGSLPGSLDCVSLPGSTLPSLPRHAELPCWHWLGFLPSLPPSLPPSPLFY